MTGEEGSSADRSFSDERWNKSARQGDVAGIALYSRGGLIQAGKALNKLASASQVDISEEITELHAMLKQLSDLFDEFTGYSADGN